MFRGVLLAAIGFAFVIHPAAAQSYWYYCDPAQAYFPYVQTCSAPWRPVYPYNYNTTVQPVQQPPTPKNAAQPTPQRAVAPPTPLQSTPVTESSTAESRSAPSDANVAVQQPPAAVLPPSDPRVAPQAEQALVAAVEAARQQYDAGANDMAKGAARPMRARATCQALGELAARDWVGHIQTLSSNGDGKGVLAISIGSDVILKTWNNDLSDAGDQTMIDPTSSLFAAASSLKEGDLVRFSGSFIPSNTDCVEEGSLTLEGSIDKPEYIFRFSSISAL